MLAKVADLLLWKLRVPFLVLANGAGDLVTVREPCLPECGKPDARAPNSGHQHGI